MPARPRVAWALAILVLPTFACEIEPPAYDGSSYGETSVSQQPSREPPREARPAGKAAAQAKSVSAADTTSQVSASPPETSEPGAASDKPAPRAFYAGGETRFLCPAGYSARA